MSIGLCVAARVPITHVCCVGGEPVAARTRGASNDKEAAAGLVSLSEVVVDRAPKPKKLVARSGEH